MKRTLIVVAAVVGFAGAAGAATLSVTSDQGSYFVGETITLNIVGTNTGEEDNTIFARLLFDATLTDNPVLATQNPHTCVPVLGGPAFDDGPCNGQTLVFLDGSEGIQEPIDMIIDQQGTRFVLENTTSTVKLIAAAQGVVNVLWDLQFGSLGVDYFNISTYYAPGTNQENAKGTTFTINVIPEPTTAALISLGLFGLLLSGRRRS